MKKIAFLLMVITIISKIVGFFREVTLSYFYGATRISDAYIISLTVPSVIFYLIWSGIITGYIPMYSKVASSQGEEEAARFTNNLVTLMLLMCTVLVILGLTFTPQVVKLFAAGFSGDTLVLAIRFTRITLFGMYFTGLVSILRGFLQIKGRFIITAAVGFPLSIVTILAIVLSSRTNVHVLATGYVIAVASQVLILVPFALGKGFRFRLVFDVRDKNINELLRVSLPVIVGTSVYEINRLVDRTMASQLAVGGISALNYSFRLIDFVQGLFVATIAVVMYPMISDMAARKNVEGMKKSLSEAIGVIILLVIPATIGLMTFSQPIVRLLFGRGAFDQEAVVMTSNALLCYSVGMLAYGLSDIASKAFYSLQDTVTPMINGIIGMVLNVSLNIVLSRFMGIAGLALATSISAIVTTGILFAGLRTKIGPFGMNRMLRTFCKVVVASALMGVAAKTVYSLLLGQLSNNLLVFASIGFGAVTYFAIIYFLKIEDVDIVVRAIKHRLHHATTFGDRESV